MNEIKLVVFAAMTITTAVLFSGGHIFAGFLCFVGGALLYIDTEREK